MTSGVYKLTFPSGKCYIGKSIRIEERWKQHLDKMTKGKAAANMQAEYNRYGTFEPSILLTCHEDHVDIMESCMISRLRPELNGTLPKDPLAHLSWDAINDLMPALELSTLEHINYIGDLLHKVKEQESDLEEQDSEIQELIQIRSKEELDADVHDRIEELQDDIEQARIEYDSLDARYTQTYLELQKWKKMSFWQRLFA